MLGNTLDRAHYSLNVVEKTSSAASFCYIIMQLVRVNCLFTGHYNTDLHVAYIDDITYS